MTLQIDRIDFYQSGLEEVAVLTDTAAVAAWTQFEMWHGDDRAKNDCCWIGRPAAGLIEFPARRGKISGPELKAAFEHMNHLVRDGKISVKGNHRFMLLLVDGVIDRFWIGTEDECQTNWFERPA